MNMQRNQKDAEDYDYNNTQRKNNQSMHADAYFWVCSRCKTKNMKNSMNCYNCAASQGYTY